MALFNFLEEVSTHSFVKDDKKILKRQSLGFVNFLWKEHFFRKHKTFWKKSCFKENDFHGFFLKKEEELGSQNFHGSY